MLALFQDTPVSGASDPLSIIRTGGGATVTQARHFSERDLDPVRLLPSLIDPYTWLTPAGDRAVGVAVVCCGVAATNPPDCARTK